MTLYRFYTIFNKSFISGFIAVTLLLKLSSCASFRENNFQEDIAFVQKYQKPIVLKNEASAIMIVPAFEARVMTSTAQERNGLSHGYLNYDFIAKNEIAAGGNPYGGEDRLWLGPLGSKYTLFYDQKEIKGDNWHVPKSFDASPYALVDTTENTAHFRKKVSVKNNIGTTFEIAIDREITIFSRKEIEDQLNTKLLKTVSSVGFQSENTITNLGADWLEKDGLIAPWVLGMFKGNDKSTAVFPVKLSEKNPLEIRKYLNDFGKDRVMVKDNIVFFKTDGSFRSKIGLPKNNTVAIMGNYDAKNKVLTIITFDFDKSSNFLSSMEKDIDDLYGGDVVNSYNNASNASGPTFFELESAAGAKILKHNEQNVYTHKTFHFKGNRKDLDTLAKQLLGIDLRTIESRF
ncbi:DUF6786 family protein [Maribacter sp. 2210JD10-5]|uniref:DUF6786 family protein n=1 Tax=Maribacter sp. 2210JD10-5 TaxID=3386272 RepID=UPI0039BC25F4